MNLPKGKRRWLKWLAGAGILVLTLIFTLLFFERIRGARALESRLAKLTERGERLKVSELEPARPDLSENAAVALLALTNRLTSGFSGLSELLPPLGRFAEPGKLVVVSRLTSWSYNKKTSTWMEVQAVLDRDPALAADIHAALGRKGWNDGFNYHNGFINLQLGPLAFWKQLTEYLTASALNAHREGRTDFAVARLEDSARLVKLQRNSPLIISQLVRLACAAITWEASWQLISSGQCNEAQLTRLQSAWEDMDFSADMSRSLEMERAMTLDHYELLIGSSEMRAKALADLESLAELEMGTAFEPPGFVFRNIHLPIWQFAWARQDQLRSLNRWQQIIEFDRLARTNSWAQVMERAATEDEDLAWLAVIAGNSEHSKMNPYDRMRYVFSGMTFSVNSHTTRKAMRAEIQRRVLVAKIAMQRYHLRHGKFADQLVALVPDLLLQVPVDMMNGKPLSYRLATNDVPVIYSVGEDGKDDGGDFSVRADVKSFKKIWDGKDAVWPEPASDEASEKAAHAKW